MRRLVVAVAVAAALAGCGYRRLGLVPGPDAARPGVFVETFANHTGEFGLEGAFRQAMTDWLQEARALRVVFDREAADYVVSGSLDRVTSTGSSYAPDDTPTGIRTALRLSWRIRGPDGRTIRRSERRETSYAADAQATMTRSRREAALRNLASEVAEQVYVQLAGLVAGNGPRP